MRWNLRSIFVKSKCSAVKYYFKYFFEWGGPCLWADNEDVVARFDLGCIGYDDLPLSSETFATAKRLVSWHDESLNYNYPPDPGPWRQEECERFNCASKQLLAVIRAEFGDDFVVIDQQASLSQDPRLDEYLKDPVKFKRS